MNSKELEPLGLKKVPVLVDGEEVVTESSVIMDYVNERYSHLSNDETVSEWREWVDNTLVHFIPPIIYKDFGTAWQTFGEVLKPSGFGVMKRTMIRFAGAMAMSKTSQKKASERGITDAPAGLIEAVAHWIDQGLAGRKFHGGETPDLADLSVFGVFRSTDDLAAVLLAKSNPAFAKWYDQLKTMTSSSAI